MANIPTMMSSVARYERHDSVPGRLAAATVDRPSGPPLRQMQLAGSAHEIRLNVGADEPAVGDGLGEAVDEADHSSCDEKSAGDVVSGFSACTGLTDDARCSHRSEQGNGNVDQKAPTPRRVLGEDAPASTPIAAPAPTRLRMHRSLSAFSGSSWKVMVKMDNAREPSAPRRRPAELLTQRAWPDPQLSRPTPTQLRSRSIRR